ncbi:MAG: hypothetical protein IJW40_10040 [Clostridia bacterium]|nr:hypothetical protein [Clostridia bacterium]
MTNKLKEKWLRLYGVTQGIGMMEPWSDFSEKDQFVYVWKGEEKSVHFTFLGDSIEKYGIACYVGEENYTSARNRMLSKNEKQEPVFMLQNALICIWDDREDISKEDYALIKSLGFSPRGKGAWLHFNRYEVGYLPTSITEADIDFLTTAFENLAMMLRAIYEQGLNPEFDKGKTLTRWYDPKAELYYTHPLEVELPKDMGNYPVVTVKENDWLREVRAMQSPGYSVELDWSYLPVVFSDKGGRSIFPRSVLAVEKESGSILASLLLTPTQELSGVAFNLLDQLIEKYGKPQEILICDESLRGILSDACKKVNIKVTVKKRLSQVKIARKQLIESM